MSVDLGSPAITTTDAVRNCLGLDEGDVSDDLIVNSGWATEVLYELGKTLPRYTEILTNAASTSPTANELKFKTVISFWLKWAVAACLAKNPQAIPFKIADGKNVNQRSEVDAEKMYANASSSELKYWTEMMEIYGLIFPANAVTVTKTRVSLFGTARPSYDPVTGGEYASE